MPVCKACNEEVDELVSMKVQGKRKKLCEDCAELAVEEAEIAKESLAAMRRMMEYKGR